MNPKGQVRPEHRRSVRGGRARSRGPRRSPDRSAWTPATDLLILDDGRVLVHDLSPAMAEVLSGLNPGDAAMRRRATRRRH